MLSNYYLNLILSGFRWAIIHLKVLTERSLAVMARKGFRLNLTQGSQMPRHLISDAHEWINEIPTVPIYHLAKPQPRERAWKNQRGKKTLLSLTLVRLCEET